MENTTKNKSTLFILSYGVFIADEPGMLTKHQTIHSSEESAFKSALNQIKSQYLNIKHDEEHESFEEFAELFVEEYERLCSVTSLNELKEFMRNNEFTDFAYSSSELGRTFAYSFEIKRLILDETPNELCENLEIEKQLLSNLKANS